MWLYPSKIEGVTNETVNKEKQAPNFENIEYDPLENSGNTLFENSSDPDLRFYNTNIQKLKYTLNIAWRTSIFSRQW